jgi:uncharacterized Zn-binding protein involved in type VI secretion
VERNGVVWVDALPVAAGTNWVTLTAMDVHGNSTTTNLQLLRSAATVTVAAVPEAQLNQPTVTVSGTVSASGYQVWVNGAKATMSGLDWTAANVPVPAGGMAVFVATAIPLTDNSGNGTPPASQGANPTMNNPTSANAAPTAAQAEKPAAVVQEYQEWTYDLWDAVMTYTSTETNYWVDILDLAESFTFTNDIGIPFAVPMVISASGTGGTIVGYCNFSGPKNVWEQGKRSWYYEEEGFEFYEAETMDTRVVLRTGGRASVHRQNLFKVLGEVTDKSNWLGELSEFSDLGYDVPVPSQQVFIPGLNQNLDTNGIAYAVLADNSEVVLTPQCSATYFGFTNTVQKLRLDLSRLRFLGSGYRSLKNDISGENYPEIHWSSDGSTNPPQSYPVLYVAGSRVNTWPEFAVGGEMSATLVLRGEASGGGTNFTLWGTNTISSSETSWDPFAEADQNLASNRVGFFNPLTIRWSYCVPGRSGYAEAGVSSNQVYVSWKTPTTTSRYHTVVAVACRNAVGQTNESNIVAGIWSGFTNRSVFKADGTGPMQYWGTNALAHRNGDPGTRLDTTAMLVKHSDGQCGAWAAFFTDVIKVNGIGAESSNIGTTNTLGSPTNGFTFQENGFYINPIAGQGNTSPLAKFLDHAVVKLTSVTNAIYDPSYGRLYQGTNMTSAEINWDDTAIEKFYTRYTSSTNFIEYQLANPAGKQAVFDP